MPNSSLVIIGGGLNGMIAACAMSKISQHVLLLDAAPKPNNTVINKAIVLNSYSIDFLQEIGLELTDDIISVTSCHVSARRHFGRVRMKSSDINLPYLGKVVPYSTLYNLISNLIATKNNIQIEYNCTVTDIDSKKSSITYKNGDSIQTITAPLVIAADGINSSCRDFANIKCDKLDIEYSSLVLNVRMNKDPHTASVRFLTPGSIAKIPTSRSTSCIIWTMPKDIIKARQELPLPQLLNLANNELGKSSGKIDKILESPISYPIVVQKAQEVSTSGMILLGNSALSLLPITAQGLNIALRDLATIYQIMKSREGVSWNEKDAEHYASLRKEDHDWCFKQVQFLACIFARENSILNIVRSCGLSIASTNPWLGDLIAIRGAGYFNYGSFNL